MPIVSCTTRIGGATKSRVLADTQPKIVMNALAKQPFADFTAEQKRYKIILRVTLANRSSMRPSVEPNSVGPLARCDIFQALPEGILKADACLVSCKHD
jgi:hypothetical protein